MPVTSPRVTALVAGSTSNTPRPGVVPLKSPAHATYSFWESWRTTPGFVHWCRSVPPRLIASTCPVIGSMLARNPGPAGEKVLGFKLPSDAYTRPPSCAV